MKYLLILLMTIIPVIDVKAQLTVDNVEEFNLEEYLKITETVVDSLQDVEFLGNQSRYYNLEIDPRWTVYLKRGMSFSEGDILFHDPYLARKEKWLVNRGWDTTNIMLWKDCYGSYIWRPKWPDETEEEYQKMRTPPPRCEPTREGAGIIFSEPKIKAGSEGTNYSFTIVCYTNFSYRKYYFTAQYSKGAINFVEKKSGGFHAY